MIALPLGDATFLSALEAETRAATDVRLAICASTGELRYASASALAALGASAPSEVPATLLVAMAHMPEDDRHLLLGHVARGAFHRARAPSSLAAGQPARSWVSIWIHTMHGGMLLLRCTDVAVDEHGTALPEEAPTGPMMSALLHVRRDDGMVTLQFADAAFEAALGLTLEDPTGPSTWLRAGLSPWSVLQLLALTHAEVLGDLQASLPDRSGHEQTWRVQCRPGGLTGAKPANHSQSLIVWQAMRAPGDTRADTRADSRARRPRPAAAASLSFEMNSGGRLTTVNGPWDPVFGVSTSDMAGERLSALCSPSARSTCDEQLLPLLQGRLSASRHEWPLLLADGCIAWFEVRLHRHTVSVVQGAIEAVVIHGELVNITRRYADTRLRMIKETALNDALVSVVICDATLPKMPIVYVNAGFQETTGYTAEEAIGRSCAFLQNDETDQPGLTALRRALLAREAITVEVKNFRKCGEMFWNRLDLVPMTEPLTGTVTHYVGMQRDVTAMVESRQAERARVAELDRVFRHLPIGTLGVHANGRVHVFSPALEALTGLRAADSMGQALPALWAHIQAQCVKPEAAPALPEPGDRCLLELHRPVRRLVEVNAASAELASGEALLFFRDVTSELELSRMKTRFLANAAHEMRAPMGSIRGFAELLLVRDYPREQAREMLDTVHRQAIRLNTLLGDLLELSKLEAQGPAAMPLGPVSIGEVANRAMKLMRLPGDKRVLTQTSDDELLQVHGHGARLEQVLINLLSNAVKYSPAGGDVALVIDSTSDAVPAGWCAVRVRDSGLGISPEHVNQLFTHFFRADPQGPIVGTGLGLVIVKELVERMGGRIDVSSELGVGSTFTVWLRRDGTTAEPPALAAA
ncbi:sensor histidine kinase [Ideonella margarita]|uniref:histidine kinase n=1 Tax=Ideonella margarita TaxID=2984191 RepID=A0ABU9C5C6_9BURK